VLRAIFLDANASKAGVDPVADYLALKLCPGLKDMSAFGGKADKVQAGRFVCF
jgi:hypothetical protein